jgi:branched-subunit amino acid ABC-type transport system permease component
VSFQDIVQYFIEGFPVGCVYALVAVGLVLTYKTSGVFNLAFGAQAFLSAAVMYEMRQGDILGIGPQPMWLCLFVSVFIVAPLFGLLLDRALFRYMRNANWVVKLVSSLGLFVALPEIIKALLTGVKPQFDAPSISSTIGIDRVFGISAEKNEPLHVGDYVIRADFVTITVVTLIMVVFLFVLFRYTALGLRMRAIVESFRMVELAGVDSERVSMFAWMLSSFLAGLAGVLLAPLVSIDGNAFTLLLVSAVAAAAFGRLTSIPLALAGGLILGIGQRAIIGLAYEQSWPQTLQKGIRPALPFLALFLLLILLPAFKGRRDVTDPLSGVDPPPPAMAHEYKDAQLARASKIAFWVVVPLFLVFVLTGMTDLWVFRITDALTLAVAFLSITVFTGLGGQVSLGQAAFAGIGGFTMVNLSVENGWPILLALAVGVLLAGIIGALLAIPALRLGGIFLTMATLAFGLMCDSIVFGQRAVSGTASGIDVNRPSVLNGHSILGPDQRWFIFVFACFAAVGYLVIFIRNGSTGRYFASLRGSETAAASIGINGTRQRILLFSLSAAIAGLGGGLIALQAGRVDALTYPALFGVAWVVLVVSLGSRTVDGALNAALGFVIFQWLLSDYFHMSASIALIGFGFGAITYARHPEGIVEYQTRRSVLATQKGRVLKERAAAMLARGPLPKGYIPSRNVTLPVLAGTLLAILLTIGRGIVSNVEGLPVWLLVLCVVPSLCFVLGWIVMTEGRLQRVGGTRRGWWIFAAGAVAGAGLGWALTNIIVRTPPFEDPQVAIDVPTGIAILVGLAGGVAVAAFFLLPVQIQQVARQRDYREIGVTWRDGRGPTLWIAIGLFLGYWATNGGVDKTGWEPTVTTIVKGVESALWPLYLLGLVATIVLAQWVGAVQGGVNELVMGEVDVAPGVPLAEDGLPEELPGLGREEDEEPLAPMAPTPTGGSD